MKKAATILAMIALFCTFTITQVSAAGGNALKSTAWTKGMADGIETKTENGETFYRATGVNAGYKSAVINIFDAVKSVAGNKEEVSVTVSFDVRADYSDDDESLLARPVLRADGLSAEVKALAEGSLGDIYEGALFKKTDAVNVIASQITSTIAVTSKWQHVEFDLDVYQEDLDTNLWTKWNLCLSAMKNFENVEAIEYKNASVTDAAGSSAAEAPTEAPDTAETTEKPGTAEATPAPARTMSIISAIDGLPTATADAPDASKGKKSSAAFYIAIGAGVVAIAAAIVTVVLLKKKKNQKDE